MTETELDTLCQIAEAAGQEIMAVYRDGGEIWQKDDQSPLTEADLRADRVIRQGLEKHFPGVFILSEESVSAGAQDSERFFLVDPLDGTKEFLKRNGEFTANVALIENGVPVAGVVLAPALMNYFMRRGVWVPGNGMRMGCVSSLLPKSTSPTAAGDGQSFSWW